MIGARAFGRLLLGAGLIGPVTTGSGANAMTRLMWRSPRNALWRTDPHAVERAIAKRERRAAIVRSNVARGAYGLNPYVGTKYLADTGYNNALRLSGLV